MKILLLGGTGAMGQPMAEILSKEGNNVYITSRVDRAQDNLHYIKGDAHDNDFLKSVLREHYDTIIDFMTYHTEEFQKRVNMLLASTDQYFYFSSSRVYADSKVPISENSKRLLDICDDEEYLKTDEYALAKARQEDILFSSGENNWTIIRPYITYNNERLQLGAMEKEKWLYRALHGKSILFSKDIAEQTTTMTYGYDVAKAIAQLIGNKQALGRAIQITGWDSMKWEDILTVYLDTIEDMIGVRPNVVMMEHANEIGERLKNKYQIKYDRLYNRVFDSSLINEICGGVIFMPMKDGLRKCLTEFIENSGKFRNISWRYEGWADKVCKETQSFSEIDGGIANKCKYVFARMGIA